MPAPRTMTGIGSPNAAAFPSFSPTYFDRGFG